MAPPSSLINHVSGIQAFEDLNEKHITFVSINCTFHQLPCKALQDAAMPCEDSYTASASHDKRRQRQHATREAWKETFVQCPVCLEA